METASYFVNSRLSSLWMFGKNTHRHTSKSENINLACPSSFFLLGGNRSRDTHLEHPKEIMIYNILILNSNFGANV